MTRDEAIDRLENIFIEGYCKKCSAEPLLYDCTKGCVDLERFNEALAALSEQSEGGDV